jgi:hypothetical protein
MSAAPSKLLGAVIRLVMREVASWKASGEAICAGGTGGSGCSARVDGVLEAKNEAEAELQKLLSSGLDTIRIQSDTREALTAGVSALFKSLCVPATLETVSPSRLAESATLAILNLVQETIKEPPSNADMFELRKGGYLADTIITATLPFFKRAKEDKDEVRANKMAALIEYFVSEVCEKAWGVTDAWSHVKLGEVVYSPLAAAAKAGSMTLVRAALESAKIADVARAACEAYCEGYSEVFELLIQTDRCLEAGRTPLVGFLFESSTTSTIALNKQREDMLEAFLRKWPQAVETVWPWGGPFCQRALEAAISLRCVNLVNTVLSLGSGIRYDNREEVICGERLTLPPTMFYALAYPSLPVMRLLVRLGALKDWQAKYTESALQTVGRGLVSTLRSCYPVQRAADTGVVLYHPDGLGTLDLLFSTGFSYSWMLQEGGLTVNVCFVALLESEGPMMAENHIIDLLKRCSAAGMDILHVQKEDVEEREGPFLATRAAGAGLNKVLDFAIEVQGPGSADGWNTRLNSCGEVVKATPLLIALSNRRLEAFQHLLRVHKAKAAYRSVDVTAIEQPIMAALMMEDDVAALPFVQELIKADLTLCDLDCFRGESTPNPVSFCCARSFRNCLEALLSAGLPGVEEMCSQPYHKPEAGEEFFAVTPAYILASRRKWDLLAMMLRHCPGMNVTTPGRVLRADGTLVRNLPPVVDLAEKDTAPIDRSLLLKLKKMAKQQQADAEKEKAIAANSAVPSNAFEDPTTKVLTEAEEKKAKKREQKKKAKAKKREAAAAAKKDGNAGAGREQEEASSSDSDSSGPDDEEEGMDEEERMLARAPTFDLEKEKAARKARAEAEKEKETKD